MGGYRIMKIRIESKPIERIKAKINLTTLKLKEKIQIIRGEAVLPVKIMLRIYDDKFFGHYFYYQNMRIGGGYFSI